MAYKKYINRNGKFYGPYEYQSKRVNGKVITEYHGSKKSNKLMISLLLLGAIAVIIAFIFIFNNSGKTNKDISGQSILEMNANYKQGEILNGKLEIILNKGELIPGDSKIVFENSGNIYEFNLNEIASEQTVQGDFYVEGKEIYGFGEGYGEEGNPIVYPDVFFNMNIYSEQGTTESSEELNEEVLDTTNESASEETNNEEPIEENNTETTQEEIPAETNEINEEVVEEETQTTEETISETSEEIPEETQTTEEIPTETSPVESAPITGDSVKGGIFSRLGPTGRATLELKNEINGVVSKDKEFVYELNSGETAEIVPLSVRTSSKTLEDNAVKLKIENNLVSATTDYSEKGEKGFGKDFVEDSTYTILIELDKLNLNLEKGDLIVKIVYSDEEILYLNAILDEEVVVEEPDEIIEEKLNISEDNLNESVNVSYQNLNESLNVSINKTREIISESIIEELTIPEKAALLSAFGNTPVSVVKSELFNGRIIIGYKLGNYEIEYSYDSSLNKDMLEREMEKDRIKWLKDISKSLLEKESLRENISDFNLSYKF
jgi:hypothetical protein